MWKRALISTTDKEDVPTLSELIGVDITSSSVFINDMIGCNISF